VGRLVSPDSASEVRERLFLSPPRRGKGVNDGRRARREMAMTFIGKLLAFLNLIIGLGFLSFAASLYFQRPSWFEPVPDIVDRGNSPVTFAQLKQDTENAGRSAAGASVAWGEQLRKLEQTEARRIDRQKEFDKRLLWARTGNPADKDTGFYEHVYIMDASGTKPTTVIDISQRGPAVTLAGTPLLGVDKLGKQLLDDSDAVITHEKDVEAKIKQYDDVSTDILREEGRKLKMSEIRTSVQSELFYLSTFEVNVYETRETVFRRKKQLTQRLMELGGLGGK
jgi:hypothetical protein